MVDEVRREIERIRGYISSGRLTRFDEANTKATAIEPVLRELDWNVVDPDEVRREYSVGSRSVDYALFCDDTLKVFIEAKRGGESLERHHDQLVRYAFDEGVEIAMLTNGATWWFYLPIRPVSWERRRVANVELGRQDSTEIAQTLVDLLSKENVGSGRALQNAERHQVLETLPEVWNQLVSEPDSSIVNLLAERTHRLCVREPDRNEVEQFLSGHLEQIQITSPAFTPPTNPTPEPVVVSDSPTESEPSVSVRISPPTQLTATPDLKFTKPTSFKFNGEIHRVESWSGMMVKLCEIVRDAHRDRFEEEVLRIVGPGGMTYFSRNRGDLEGPRPIRGTAIYVKTQGGGKMIVERAERLITHFQYDEDDFGYSAVRGGEPIIRVRM